MEEPIIDSVRLDEETTTLSTLDSIEKIPNESLKKLNLTFLMKTLLKFLKYRVHYLLTIYNPHYVPEYSPETLAFF